MRIVLNEPIFQKGFEIAELAQLTSAQYEQYHKSLLQYWDLKNIKDTAFEEGEKSGFEKTAIAMLLDNESVEKIVKYTQLPVEKINSLKITLKNGS